VITPSVITQSCCTQYFWMISHTVCQFIGIPPFVYTSTQEPPLL
jgi:hypothetical protein